MHAQDPNHNPKQTSIDYHSYPDKDGHFGIHGGQFISETLMAAIDNLQNLYDTISQSQTFWQQYQDDLTHYVGRPTPLYLAKRLTQEMGGATIFLKREDLNHTGAHKINNTIGQALLAKMSGKTRLIAETGAGQHGVATATIAARLGLECVIYMGADDVERQKMNVYRMQLLGATVKPVTSGSRTLKDAMNEAMRDWVTHVDNTYYVIGTVAGPHPYPKMVRDFQAIIGKEARIQHLEQTGKLPDALVACVGGGSNAIGLFFDFLNEPDIKIFGVEATGEGIPTGRHSAPLTAGRIGVLHGNRTYLMADDDGQIIETHSISAGLDYPGVGPEHSFLKDTGRVQYVGCTDEQAMWGFKQLTQKEGIIPALESSHAIAYGLTLAQSMQPEQSIIINLSGRGDKDLHTVMKKEGIQT